MGLFAEKFLKLELPRQSYHYYSRYDVSNILRHLSVTVVDVDLIKALQVSQESQASQACPLSKDLNLEIQL